MGDEVLTLEEVAKFLEVPADAVRSRAEEGELAGRRFGKEWRFARMAVLAWLADGEAHKRGGRMAKSRERSMGDNHAWQIESLLVTEGLDRVRSRGPARWDIGSQ